MCGYTVEHFQDFCSPMEPMSMNVISIHINKFGEEPCLGEQNFHSGKSYSLTRTRTTVQVFIVKCVCVCVSVNVYMYVCVYGCMCMCEHVFVCV